MSRKQFVLMVTIVFTISEFTRLLGATVNVRKDEMKKLSDISYEDEGSLTRVVISYEDNETSLRFFYPKNVILGYVRERKIRGTKVAALSLKYVTPDDSPGLVASCCYHSISTQLGLQAMKHLLREARFLNKFAYGEKIYIKNGGYERALKDFYKVKPTDVKDLRIGHGKQGKVGDKVIRVLDAVGHISTPALSISGNRGAGLPQIIIKYRNIP